MAKKLYISGNYIVADKDNGSPLLHFPQSQSAFHGDANSYNLIALASGTGGGDFLDILYTDITDWYDEAGSVAFSAATMLSFLRDNSGFSRGAGSASVGILDYNDVATQTTPIEVTGGAGFVDLTNDEQGSSTNKLYPPLGVTDVWDADND